MTIAIVTHERSLAEKVADRLAIMGDGKLVSNPGRVFCEYLFHDMYYYSPANSQKF